VISALIVFGLVGLSSAQFGFSLSSLSSLLTTTPKPRVNKGNVAVAARTSLQTVKQTVATETSSVRRKVNSESTVNHHVSIKLNTATNQESNSNSKGFEMKLNLASSGQDGVKNQLAQAKRTVAAKLDMDQDLSLSATKEKLKETRSTLSSKLEYAHEKFRSGLESAKAKAEKIKNKLAKNDCLQKVHDKVDAKIRSMKETANKKLKENNLDTKIQKAEEKISEFSSSIKRRINEKSPVVQEKLEKAKEKLDSLSASIRSSLGEKWRSLKLCA